MVPVSKINKKIEIPSDIVYIKDVSREILAHLEARRVDKAIQFDIRLALEEAVRNAIEHGNCYDRDLTVTVDYGVTDAKIDITVKDQGRGFDAEKVPDPRHGKNIMKDGGRGVFLIQKIMDKVTYNTKGNAVRMTKHF